MAAAKLVRHFETKNSEHKGRPLRFFSRMLEKLSSKKTDVHTKFKSENETALIASMQVSYRIEREVKRTRSEENLLSSAQPCN
jgi:hypothetical protein